MLRFPSRATKHFKIKLSFFKIYFFSLSFFLYIHMYVKLTLYLTFALFTKVTFYTKALLCFTKLCNCFSIL